EELLLGRGDERGEVGGDAGLEECLARLAVPLGVGREEVHATEAVHLEVDEPGHCDPTTVGGRESERRHPTARDLDVARHELPVAEGSFAADTHSECYSA